MADITEHPSREGKLYCCVVLGVLSPPGGGLGDRQSLGHPAGHRPPKRARESGLLPSMGTIGDAYDNAVIESFLAHMQTELVDRQ